jgi:outer membrane protein assembly factor BamB
LEQGESGVPSVVWTSAESLIKDRIVAPPLQIGSQVFVGTADNYMYALDASNNGALQWQFETGHSIWGQPTYEDGILYVSSLDKSLYALDAETGDMLWESTTGGSISDRAKLNGDLVYISSFDRMIHAVEKDTGDVRWTANAEAAVWGAPAFEDEIVYYGDLNGNLFAVDAETGSELWTKRFDSYMVAAPVVKDGVLFASTAGLLETEAALRTGSLIALDAITGDELWREATPTPIFTTPVFIQDTIVVTYIVNNILNLVVFDTADGSDLWTFQPTTVTE